MESPSNNPNKSETAINQSPFEDVRTRSQIGDRDDRVPIFDSNSGYWQRICSLEITAQGFEVAYGTGWLAGPRTVITAGHCLHNHAIGGWAQSVVVMPGRATTEVSEDDKATSNSFDAMSRWKSHQDRDYDIGVIFLAEALGERFGWFGYDVYDDDSLKNGEITVAGFPEYLAGRQMVRGAGRILATSPKRIYYDADSSIGQSGAPVLLETETDPAVIAIHAYAERVALTELGIEANSAPRITPEIFEQIREWVRESGED